MAEMSKNAAKYKLVLKREEYRVYMLHTSCFPAKVSELHIIHWTTVMYTNIQRRNIGTIKGAFDQSYKWFCRIIKYGMGIFCLTEETGNGTFTVHTCESQLM